MSVLERPTLEQVKTRLLEKVVGQTAHIPKTRNKGLVGLWIEAQTGIPMSSACLDCVDGEVKLFPVKNKAGTFVAKETIAVTMVDQVALRSESFEESRVFRKLQNTLYVPYFRDGDDVHFFAPVHLTAAHPIFVQLKADFEAIRASAVLTARVGHYLQTRTKGPGHGSTSRAFYLRPLFADTLILPSII
jgi:DNA mismatch repair protein MutH